jgi:SET domain-containing protein
MDKKNYSWINPKLEVKNVGSLGTGVFAIENIKKGEVLSIFGGYIITFKEESLLPLEYKDYGMLIHDNFVITSYDHKEFSDSFNHSCDPNAGIKGQIFVVAMKNIKSGKQVNIDYAMCLSYSKKHSPYFYDMKCLCGSKKCRGQITANDWKIKGLQKKYNGYFQWYIQEKINKNK